LKKSRAGAYACRVAFSATVASRAVETGSIGCTCTSKKIMHGTCLVLLLTDLVLKVRGIVPRLVILNIFEFQDPVAAKTWGRQYLDVWAEPKRTRLPDVSASTAADGQYAKPLGGSIAISAGGDIRGGGEERKCQWRQYDPARLAYGTYRQRRGVNSRCS
jgi:hypothetical protein